MCSKFQKVCIAAVLAAVLAGGVFVPSARANVYATNIKLNGGLNSVTNSVSGPVSIGYILNEAATLGVTINISSGTNVVRAINIVSGAAGTLKGTNIVVWDGQDSNSNNVPTGIYDVSIVASAKGFTTWTQTSTDTNTGYYVYSARGIAVNNNPNSIYYGRVFVGNATQNGTITLPGDVGGILKANADGSLADEGQGNTNGLQGGFQWDTDGFNGNPHFLRYGQDDRIYALDWDVLGVVVAFDMATSTNEIVLNANNYANNEVANFSDGWGEFDVTDAGTTNGRIFLGDNDSSGAGLWFWHLTNGIADPNDTTGTQVIAVGGDLDLYADGGSMMDSQSNIYAGQNIGNTGNQSSRVMEFTNWDGMTTLTNGTAWMVGGGDDTFLGNFDLALDSRVNPKYVAVCLGNNDLTLLGGLRVLNATNGLVVSNATQVLTNLDVTNQYFGVAWDGAGNLYGAIANIGATNNKWRVFSPPGTNQATTVAVETIQVGAVTPVTIKITSLTLSGTTVTITFTGATTDSPSAFTLQSSAVAGSGYANVGSANFSQISAGNFRVTTTAAGSTQFYRIKR